MSLEIQQPPNHPNQWFINVGNIRVTMVMSRAGRAGPDVARYLRFQAYRGDRPGSKALHRGAEIPIRSRAEACELAAAVGELLSREFTDVESGE